jgi:hypothetical protein
MKTILLTLAGLAGIILILSPTPPKGDTLADPPGPRDRIAPRTLVNWVISGDQHYHLLDIRPAARFLEDGLRTAESMPADSISEAIVRSTPSGHMIVLYGETDEDVIAPFQRIKAIHEQTYILSGGHTACEKEYLTPPEPPTGTNDEEWDEYRTRLALVNYLTGQADAAPVAERRSVRPVMRPRIKVQNEGC